MVIGIIATTVLMASGAGLVLNALAFTMPLEPAWSLWRLFTYTLIQQPSFFTLFSLFFFYWFSAGIETHLGRGVLTRLLILLVLIPPAVAAIIYWTLHVGGSAVGGYSLTCGLLVAFATLYPNTEAMGWIPFKWATFACIFFGSLMFLISHDMVGLTELLLSCAAGFAYIRHAKEAEYDDHVSPFSRVKELFRRKPKFRVVPAPSTASYHETLNEPASEMDTLLDKIAKSGMSSLTTKEKATLERAREALIRKDQR
ncbi:MAG TPA: DUF6576 domain-containing protein [Chthoniobacter sp.]|nr:DUF6576 domain-containing protein [Chthoniobacter sp.]